MLTALILSSVLSVEPFDLRLKVGEIERQAHIYHEQPSEGNAPVVFVFHGHGGQIRNTARRMKVHEAWPEAIVVYPQGRPTPGIFDPEGKRPGWSSRTGSIDFDFFDAMLEWLRKNRRIDADRIYAMGHSNGAGFTYGLAGQRASVLAAVAPSAGAPERQVRALTNVPILHVAGRNDMTVKFANQQASFRLIEQQLKMDRATHKTEGRLTSMRNAQGVEFATYVHDGDHRWFDECLPPIIKFFKQNPRQSR